MSTPHATEVLCLVLLNSLLTVDDDSVDAPRYNLTHSPSTASTGTYAAPVATDKPLPRRTPPPAALIPRHGREMGPLLVVSVAPMSLSEMGDRIAG
ncbi:hypothetical protein V500_06316 [Pseudogymnoascus sp. VKM F-4518 (FW-2643)]|nr:hypothetical protein V500_06316 [Pseudogymnoascus sp. VKM F-4518 (FW-2643)]